MKYDRTTKNLFSTTIRKLRAHHPYLEALILETVVVLLCSAIYNQSYDVRILSGACGPNQSICLSCAHFE